MAFFYSKFTTTIHLVKLFRPLKLFVSAAIVELSFMNLDIFRCQTQHSQGNQNIYKIKHLLIKAMPIKLILNLYAFIIWKILFTAPLGMWRTHSVMVEKPIHPYLRNLSSTKRKKIHLFTHKIILAFKWFIIEILKVEFLRFRLRYYKI